MIRRLTISLNLVVFAIATLAGCSRTGGNSADAYPTIVVDMNHSLDGGGGEVHYQIPPGKGIRLDAQQFDFRKLGGPATPSVVQVAIAPGQIFTTRWVTPGKTFVIDASTMAPVEGEGVVFPGFVSGQRMMISVGVPIPGQRIRGVHACWVAMAEVR
jgi:hypothetical protein